MKAVIRREGEQLDETGCLPQAPRILPYGSVPYRDRKAAQQPDAYGLNLSNNGVVLTHVTNIV